MRAKHRNDHNHGKNGMIGGNPRHDHHATDQRGNHAPKRRKPTGDGITGLLGQPDKDGVWRFGMSKCLRFHKRIDKARKSTLDGYIGQFTTAYEHTTPGTFSPKNDKFFALLMEYVTPVK